MEKRTERPKVGDRIERVGVTWVILHVQGNWLCAGDRMKDGIAVCEYTLGLRRLRDAEPDIA